MDFDTILTFLISNLPAMATILSLVIALVRYIQKAVKEKNWRKLLELVFKYMSEAEGKFSDGAEREEWVIAMIKVSADEINYPIDYDEVRQMIRDICEMTKKVNPPALEASK